MSDTEKGLDWAAIESWDRNYYLHNTMAASEYTFTGVERVDGNYITLANGARLLDFQSQLVSDSLGHRHDAPHDAIKEAMSRYGHVFFGMATDYRARAAKLLIEDVLGAPKSWASRVRFLTSGTEAVENAVQAARLFTGRSLIMTQAHSFHGMASGSTFLRGYRGNLTLPGEGGFAQVRDIPGVPAPGFLPIPPPEHTDFQADGSLPSLVATEQLIRACGPENIAAIITEPMFGAAGLMPHANYYRDLYRLLQQYGILWIDDEVLCGAGRLGEWFGYQLTDGIEPDIMIVGKGINGSSLPSGGMVVNHAIGDFLESARWWSGSTWDGHPLVCASIVGTLTYMLENDILTTVKARGDYLRAQLEQLAARHSLIGRISGAGLYLAVDLVNDQGTPLLEADRYTAFSGDLTQYPNAIISGACAEKGVFLGGFVPNTIKCAPPFTITEDEIDTAMQAFDFALQRLAETYTASQGQVR